MKTIQEHVDVAIVGGGTAGHIAAIQAARLRAKTSVIEAGTMLGGTMTSGGVFTPCFFYSPREPVVLGIPWELYQKSKAVEGLPPLDFRKRRPAETPGAYSFINIPIYVAVAEEEALKAGVSLHFHEFVANIAAVGNTWEITSLGRGLQRITTAREVIDCSGDSDVVRLLGLEVLTSEKRQPATFEYKIEGIDPEQIWEKEVQRLYEEAMANGTLQKGDFAYPNLLPFKYYLDQGGHNSTHVYNSDTSTADGQTLANLEGRARMLRMFKFLTSTIPGCERVVLKYMASHAVARETHRILGEIVVTRQDFMTATDFPDKICNAFNYVDLHSQDAGCEVTFLDNEALLPKIPMRALIPKGSERITAAGRIVSADQVAFAGVRAQCTCMAMGQAMGAAAALAVQRGMTSREIPSQDVVAATVEHGAVPV
jgi:hypothetical protein